MQRLDVATGSFTGSAPTGGSMPAEMATNANGSRIYVAHFGGKVTSIDPATLSIVDSYQLTGDATAIIATPTNDTVVVGTRSRTVHRIKLANGAGTVVASATLPAATMGDDFHFAWNQTRTRLYVASDVACKVYELDATSVPTLTLLRTFNVDVATGFGVCPEGLAVSGDGTKLFMTSQGGTASWNIAANSLLLMGGGCGGFLLLLPDNSRLNTSCHYQNAVTALNPVNLVPLETRTVGGTPRQMSYDAGSGRVIVPNEQGWVDVIDVAPMIGGGPYGSVVTSSGIAWIGQRQNGTMQRLIVATGLFTASAPTGGSMPAEMATNANGSRIYVAHFGGKVPSIDPATLSIVDSYQLTGDATAIIATPTNDTVVVGTRSRTVHRIKLANGAGTVVASATLPAATMGDDFHFAWNQTRTRLYVASDVACKVYELDATSVPTLTLLRTFNVDVATGFGVCPEGLAVSGDGTKLFMTSQGGTASWNIAANSLLLMGGGCGGFLLLLPDNSRLYTSCHYQNAVTALNPVNLVPLETRTVGGTPRQMSYDAGSGRVIVPNEQGGVDVIDVAPMIGGGPYGSVVTSSGIAWIGQRQNGTMQRLIVATGLFTASAPTGGSMPAEMATNAHGTRCSFA